MSTQETRQVLQGYLTGHGPEWLAEAVEFHDTAHLRAYHGRTEATAWLAAWYTGAFSDAHADVVSLVAAENVAAAEWVFHGVHTGSLTGERPTGRPVRLPMSAFYEVERGEIVRARLYYDTALLKAQLEPSAPPPDGEVNEPAAVGSTSSATGAAQPLGLG
jgi:predicted ester cyclase